MRATYIETAAILKVYTAIIINKRQPLRSLLSLPGSTTPLMRLRLRVVCVPAPSWQILPYLLGTSGIWYPLQKETFYSFKVRCFRPHCNSSAPICSGACTVVDDTFTQRYPLVLRHDHDAPTSLDVFQYFVYRTFHEPDAKTTCVGVTRTRDILAYVWLIRSDGRMALEGKQPFYVADVISMLPQLTIFTSPTQLVSYGTRQSYFFLKGKGSVTIWCHIVYLTLRT